MDRPPVCAQDELTFVLEEAWAYPVDSADSESPGFNGRIHQAFKGSGLTATIARGNAQLNGTLFNPGTEEPYVNLVVDTENEDFKDGNWEGETAVEPGGVFVLPEVINYSADSLGFPLDIGNFDSTMGHEDRQFPGIPGSDDDSFSFYENGLHFAIEFLAWLELPAGEIVLGVRHDDAMEVAFHGNDARDIFRSQAVGFDSNSGKTDRTVLVDVPVEGLYSVRVLLAQWSGDTELEFYTADPDAPDDLTLVNDPSNESSVKAWHSLMVPARPYISAVSPAGNATGVARDTDIAVTVQNLGDAEPTLKVNETEVIYTKSEDGSSTTLLYQPEVGFGSGQTVDVELAYGVATSTWSFVAKSGSRALLITGGGQLNGADGWVANRLASVFGLDVIVKADGGVTVDDADDVALIFNSSTVNSGQVAGNDFELLPIPIINVEGGNVDDFLFSDVPIGWGNGPNSGQDAMLIENNEHPISMGLELGELKWSNSRTQYHWGSPPESATVIARPLDDETRGILYVLEEGAEILTDDEVPFVHPARRVFFGFTGNDGAASYNESGAALFDATVSWALDVGPDTSLMITGFEHNSGDNTATLLWRSVEGNTYAVSESNDLSTWIEIDDGVEATGDETTYSLSNVPDGRNYYRVVGEQ